MKKIFALLLVLLMLLPSIVACGGTDDPVDTGSGGEEEENPFDGTEPIDTKKDLLKYFDGKTLNVLATNWYGANGKANGWSEPDLAVTGYDMDGTSVWGKTINNAIQQRREHVKSTYGVELKFIMSQKEAIMSNQLVEAMKPEATEKYHIAMPRIFEAQQLIQNQSLYDLSGSNCIDFSKSYYNQMAHEMFTVAGHTFFAAGDFSFLDEYTSYVMYYNMAVSENIESFPDLYQTVKDGKWTISEMAKWAAYVSDDNGANAGAWEDDDTYGFGTTTLTQFFQTSGITQIRVDNESSNPADHKYIVSLNDDVGLVTTLVEKLKVIVSSEWARTQWGGNGYGPMEESFFNGKLLFYMEVVEKFGKFTNQGDNFKVGVLPIPKLNESESYYTPCANQSTVMCIPKCTPDRDMSEYFFDVLSHTGQDFVMKGFYDNLQTKVYNGTKEGEKTAADSMEILKNHIFNNLMFDIGYTNGILTVVQSDTLGDTSNANAFSESYTENMGDALEKVAEWNLWYQEYKE
ncbi:MAG: hypothetical protein J6K52_01510 [Clostridia bacterium]|nr:hypothetical protein [Clostridia bacterium]